MYIWGGRFQSVSQISGLWRLDIFTSGDVFTNDANLNLVAATPDGIEAYEAELEALHLFIAVMMFVSLTMSSLFGMMRRQEEERGAQGVSTVTSRRGLSRQVIDSLPLKRYETHRGVTDDGDVVEDVSLSRENSREETALQVEDDAECCPICLVEYEEGCEIRTLPCGHDFDKQCIDMWLDNHTSCPACRQSISNTPLPPQETLSADNDDGGSNGENNAQDTISYNLQFIPTSLHWLARRAMMNVVDRRDRQWFGPLESHQSDSSMDDAVATDVSNSSQAEEEDDVTTQVEASQGDNSMRPRFLGMRRFFRARGNVRMQVPGDEIAVPSIELV